MATKEINQLTAGSTPIDDLSVIAVDVWDGASTFDTRKFTFAQLDARFGGGLASTLAVGNTTGGNDILISQEDKITVDSGGTNKLVLDDVSTSNTIYFNEFGTNEISFSTDNNAYGAGAGQLVLNPALTNGGTYFGADPMFWGFSNADFINGGNAAVPSFSLEWTGVTNSGLSLFSGDNSANTLTGKALDANVVMAGGNANIATSGVVNSFIGGGAGVNANKDGYAFFENLEVQGGTFSHTGSELGVFNTTPTTRTAAYTPTNVTNVRTFDANSTSLEELADVVGTMIADFQLYGHFQ
jgi:hypothetical protein